MKLELICEYKGNIPQCKDCKGYCTYYFHRRYEDAINEVNNQQDTARLSESDKGTKERFEGLKPSPFPADK